jgi:hypothetical protein
LPKPHSRRAHSSESSSRAGAATAAINRKIHVLAETVVGLAGSRAEFLGSALKGPHLLLTDVPPCQPGGGTCAVRKSSTRMAHPG